MERTNNGRTMERTNNNVTGTHERTVERTNERTNERTVERTSTTTISIDRWKDGLSLSVSVEWSGVEWVRGPRGGNQESKPTHHTSQPANQPANQPASQRGKAVAVLQRCSCHPPTATDFTTHSLTHPPALPVCWRSLLPSFRPDTQKEAGVTSSE